MFVAIVLVGSIIGVLFLQCIGTILIKKLNKIQNDT